MSSALASARLGVALAAALVALALTSAVADAATYTVWSCRGPDGAPLSTGAWSALGKDGGQDGCSSGGSLNARIPSGHDEPYAKPYALDGYRFALPDGALIAGYRIHLYAATAGPPKHWLRQAGIDSDGGSRLRVDAGCLVAGCTAGVAGEPLSADNLLQAADLKSSGLALIVRCGWWPGCRRSERGRTLAELRLFRSQVDVIDDEAPLVGRAVVTGGSAAATVSDRGGGVAVTELLIDGSPVARRDAGGPCVEPYVLPAPCPAETGASFDAGSAALAPGTHSVAVRATDAAGNSATGEAAELTVGGPAPPAAVLGEHVVQVPVAVVPQRVVIRAERRRVRLAGRGASVAGIVTDGAGTPVAGAHVRVSSRPFGVRRSKTRLETTLTSGADGRFRATMRGRSRLLLLDVDDAQYRAADQAEVELLQPLSVHVLVPANGIHNGSTMRLRVRVEGAGEGVAGKALIVMTTVRGKWTPIGSLTTNARGEAVWPYQFEGTVIPAHYRFRVRVERAGDVWPWATIDSRTAVVEVRP